MSTRMPLDTNDNPIPALRFKNDGAHTVNFTNIPVRTTVPFDEDTRIVSLYATQNVYVRFGNDSVTADSGDHFIPAGLYYDVAIGGDGMAHYTHLAAVRGDTNGVLYISEKE